MKKSALTKIKTKKSQERYELFLSVGQEMFLKKGFENTSLNDIIAKSKGSLSSIYKYFGSKEGLFEAIINKGIEKIYDKMQKNIDFTNKDLKKFLRSFANEFLDIVLSTDAIIIEQIVFSQSFKKNSKIGAIFFENGVKKIYEILINFFSQPEIKSQLGDYDLELLAARLCFILKEPYCSRKFILGIQENKIELNKSEWIENCIEFFLNGVGYKNNAI